MSAGKLSDLLVDVPHVELRRTQPLKVADVDFIMKGSISVLPLLREILAGREQESFITLMCDARNHVFAWREVARGRSSSVEVPVREMFRTALHAGAASIIVSHNHPLGDPTPSPEDVIMTEKLLFAGLTIGCPILDHIIIGDGERYHSFREKGAITSTLSLSGQRQGPELD